MKIRPAPEGVTTPSIFTSWTASSRVSATIESLSVMELQGISIAGIALLCVCDVGRGNPQSMSPLRDVTSHRASRKTIEPARLSRSCPAVNFTSTVDARSQGFVPSSSWLRRTSLRDTESTVKRAGCRFALASPL
eukprot:GHVR01031364.1.p1 GENE.GHVR01031364.1~~GHVR01031364.1.p1  ORF type:complete len:135 (-),score=0.35 GHVR01031364.1:262-666(-)